MKLKNLLTCLGKNELIDIIFHSMSNGAYTVNELLTKDEILEKDIPEKGIEIRIEKAGDFVAEDSELRNEYFQEDAKLPYMLLEIR